MLPTFDGGRQDIEAQKAGYCRSAAVSLSLALFLVRKSSTHLESVGCWFGVNFLQLFVTPEQTHSEVMGSLMEMSQLLPIDKLEDCWKNIQFMLQNPIMCEESRQTLKSYSLKSRLPMCLISYEYFMKDD